MMTPKVAAIASSPWLKTSKAKVTRMFVLPAGPPRVVKKMTAKRLKVQMMPSRMTIVLTERRPGMVMFQKDCQRLAPSTRAASY